MSNLVSIPPDKIAAIARKVKIIDHETGITSLWKPNQEQLKIWQSTWEHPWVFVLKVRQIGASTAVCLEDVLWTAANDASGNEVHCAIYIDTDDKAKALLQKCAGFAEQLGLDVVRSSGGLRFPNGSSIQAMTAGGRRAGASLTFQRHHLTELPFWRDPVEAYTSLMQALIVNGVCVVETTMGVADSLGKNLYLLPNKYHNVFFPFESHLEYRANPRPDSLTPEAEEWLRSEGFTDPYAMQCWLNLLSDKCGGDVVRCFREYPQLEKHAFLFAEGRWCQADPEVLTPLREVEAVNGQKFKIFREPSQCSTHLVIGVDTAGGLDKDRSAAVVYDGVTNQVCASYVSSTVKIYDFVPVVQAMQQLYTRRGVEVGSRTRDLVPPAVIEVNGIGRSTMQECYKAGVLTYELVATDATKYNGLSKVARLIEAGTVYGPSELLEEATELRTKNGKFLGHKDLFSAIGFCLVWLDTNKPKDYTKERKTNANMIASFRKRLRRGSR